jgi:hypothetical protein
MGRDVELALLEADDISGLDLLGKSDGITEDKERNHAKNAAHSDFLQVTAGGLLVRDCLLPQ